jgi:mxaJ protein
VRCYGAVVTSKRSAAAIALVAALATFARRGEAVDGADAGPVPELRVCADPNNLPFSNEREEGFENALAGLVAQDLGWRLGYVWWAQRRGFVRNTLRAGLCDVVMGVPAGYDLALTTRPYYRSTYVFVTRRDGGPPIASLDAPALRQARIGIHLIGDDYANPPPAQALARRGIVGNVRGFTIYGDYSRPDPPRALIDAVADGSIDVAIAWGPLAGYFAHRAAVPLDVVPVSPSVEIPFSMFVFDIAMGVRRGDVALRDRLDGVIVRREREIRHALERWNVPLVGVSGAAR